MIYDMLWYTVGVSTEVKFIMVSPVSWGSLRKNKLWWSDAGSLHIKDDVQQQMKASVSVTTTSISFDSKKNWSKRFRYQTSLCPFAKHFIAAAWIAYHEQKSAA